ncbi:MAG TPA: hypothetical protein VFX47_05270 [Gammaproteobacteria bacterium]|nr:hypothetical protein [Gammaproteobacteria bacterium]
MSKLRKLLAGQAYKTMANRNNNTFPFLAAALAGLVVCLIITVITGRKEAWDSAAYFSIGIPVMCLLIFVISYLFPVRIWRWVLCMAIGQSVAMLLGGGSLSLWPLSIIVLAILSIPQWLSGFVASKLVKRKVSEPEVG